MPWPRFRATRLDPAGVPAGELPVAVGADGRGILRLDHEPSLWFLLRR
jgi:hypothetical protein